MELRTNVFRRLAVISAGLAMAAFCNAVAADPPARVARLSYISGPVSFSPASEDDWDEATINRPLSPGDRLWADTGARTEMQLGGTMVRLGDATAVSLLNLDDEIAQVQLTEGRLDVRVRRLEPGQSVEVDTPHLAFTLRQPGAYRIDVEPDGTATTIRMRDGEGEVTSEGVALLLRAPQVQRFIGDGVPDESFAATLPPPDDFDRWAVERDRRAQVSVSARYVSPDVIGYEDLDDEGSWSVEATYGNVWYPRRVAVDWAPYRHGHWTWIDPWGWTWVDDAPWGFAVSHYGRWAHIRGRWGWIPGPVRTRAYYAPALVAFVGGPNFSLSVSIGGGGGGDGVAWFPLGPREVYRPAYRVSPRYFEQVNVSNTVVNKTVVKNVYVTKVTNVTYVNRRVPGAVVAVPRTAFVQSQPIAKVVVKAPKEVIESREVAEAAPVAPVEKSVRGSAQPGRRPPAQAFTRAVVAKTAPPPPKPSFAAQRERLAQQPGKPLDDDQRRQVRASLPAAGPAASAVAPAVKVVRARAAASAPVAREPRQAEGSASEPREGRRAGERRAADQASAPRAADRRASEPREARAADRRASEAPEAREARASEPAVTPETREARKARKATQAASAVRERAASVPSDALPAARPPRPAASAPARRPPASVPAPAAQRPRPPAAAEAAASPPSREQRQAERAARRAERASAAAEGATEPRRRRNADDTRP